MVERTLQIAEGCIEDMEKDKHFRQRDIRAVKEKLLPKDFLANIFHFRICSYTELIAMINHLDKWVSEHRDVGTKLMPRILVVLLFESPLFVYFLVIHLFCSSQGAQLFK